METHMTFKEAEAAFREYVLPSIRDVYEANGVPDYIARAEKWNNWTDALCKDGTITEKQYETWSQPRCCNPPRGRYD